MRRVDIPLKLFTTTEQQCPYFCDRNTTNTLVDPNFRMNTDLYSCLINLGFRRSGDQVYRPQCFNCKECISTRILVDEFKHSRSHRRNWKMNQDLQVKIKKNTKLQLPSQYKDLYLKYLFTRHGETILEEEIEDELNNGGDFMVSQWTENEFLEYWLDGELLGVALVDVLKQGLSAVYTFFDPYKGAKRSLGTYSILYQIYTAKKIGLPYVYLGYWIKDCRKMSYKIRYKPLEGLINDKWRRL